MPLPKSSSIEIPVLQELVAVGGGDNVRFLYGRLIGYFPQISVGELSEIKNGANKGWRVAVQKAGKVLEEKNLIRRKHGFWTITGKGKLEVEADASGFSVTETVVEPPPSHSDIQQSLIAIGESLGFSAAVEFEYYDVVWREKSNNQRLSHVFEVQSRGNIDSAFAKLKRAYEAQRTKPFLIVSTERDLNRARQSLTREFHDIQNKVTILTFAQIRQVQQNLAGIAEIIREFLLK